MPACPAPLTRGPVDPRGLGNEDPIDAKPGSAALLPRVLLEHVDGYPSSSEADSRCEPAREPPTIATSPVNDFFMCSRPPSMLRRAPREAVVKGPEG
jgi:hypothetical protein